MISFLITMNDCSDAGLSQILLATQRILKLIQLLGPILLLIMASIHLTQLLMYPDDKKRVAKIRNAFIATAALFFIPMFVNVFMSLLGDSFLITSCWNLARESTGTPTYIDPYGSTRTQPIVDPTAYEPGEKEQPISGTGVHGETSGNMKYYVYVPKNATTNMPLLIWLHGDGGTEENAKNNPLGETALSAGYPAIVVSPHTPSLGTSGNPGWAEGGHLQEVKKIADEVCEKYKCDKSNINIGGHSRGAIGTWMMASEYPGYFHAAAPVSCCAISGFHPESFKGVKVWAMRGTGAGSGNGNDDIYGSCMQSSVNKVKPYVKAWKYTILPGTTHGGAGSNAVKNKEMVKFIFSD